MRKLFTLLFLLIYAGIYSQNLIEGFEGAAFPPNDWTVINNGDPNTWGRTTTNPRTGVACAAINYGSIAHDDYLISPQLVPATGNSTFSFWSKNGSSNWIEKFNVKLSTTGNAAGDFTVILASEVGPPTTYTQYSYDLSAYIGQNVYVAVQSISTDMLTLYIDDVTGPFYISNFPPSCATNVSPTIAATNVPISSTLNWADGGGLPTGYKLFFGTDNPPTNIVNGTDLGFVTTYDPTPDMNYATKYYWKVVPYNSIGDATGCTVWSFTTICNLFSVPFSESFDATTFAPTCWTNVKTAGSGTPGIWDRQITGTYPTCTPHSGLGMARFNCYSLSSGTKGILVTPQFTIPSDQYRVLFWMFRDNGYATTADLVNVYYNTNPNTTGATLLGTVNRSYSRPPVVATPNQWYQYIYNLPVGSSGNGYVIFEAVSAYGNNIFVDDVSLAEIPPTPFYTFSPETVACGYAAVGGFTAEQTYTIAGNNLTGAPGNIVVTAPANFEVSLTTGTGFAASVNVAYTSGTLSPTTVYVRCIPTTPNTGFSGNITHVGGGASGNVAVTGNSYLYAGYCISAATSTADEEILRVTLGTLNNTSTCLTTGGPGSILNQYSNYTLTVPPVSLEQYSNNPFSVQIGTCGGNYSNAVKIFIDFNQNGLFPDPGEEVYISAASTSGPHIETGNIFVPFTATLGQTMMRVVNVETSPPGGITPCGTYSWGETEDYLVNITAAPGGTLIGHVTDCYSNTPIAGATVSIGMVNTTTNASGDYSFLTPLGTFTVTCSKTGYVNKTVGGVVVTLNQTTTQNVCLNEYLPPPVALQASVNLQDVHLSWLPPGSISDQWIKWDNGSNFTGIGYDDAAVFKVASRWPVVDISPFGGAYLKKVRFFPMVSGATYTIMVWKGANAGTLLYSQVVPSPLISAWNEVVLTTPVPIDGSQEFWFGYEVNTPSGFPAGADAGPAVVGKGDMFFDGTAWISIFTAYALNYNWNLQGWISASLGDNSNILQPISQTLSMTHVKNPGQLSSSSNQTLNSVQTTGSRFPGGVTMGDNASAQSPVASQSPLQAPLIVPTGYNVYRNSVKIGDNIPVTSYDDLGLPKGGYDYEVSAQYAQGESDKIGPVHVNIYTCFPPTNLQVANATLYTTQATATWTPSVFTPTPNWIIEYGLKGFVQGTGTTASLSVPSYQMTGLTAGTEYDFYVRTYCTPGDSSVWVKKTFRTHYFECPHGVDEGEICGDTINNGCNLVIQAFGLFALNETKCGTAYFNGTTRDTDWFTFVITQTTDITLTARAEFSLQIGIIQPPCPVTAFLVSNTGVADASVSVTTQLTPGTYFAFIAPQFAERVICDSLSGYYATLSASTCLMPTALTATGITGTTADLGWSSTATSWNIEWGLAGFIKGTGTVISGTTLNPYTLTGLAGSTAYSYYVQSDCGGLFSAWAGPFTFTTACIPVTIFPYTQGFSATMPTCWSASEGVAGASYHWEPVTADASNGAIGPQSGTHFMRLYVYLASATYNPYYLTTSTFSFDATPKQVKYKYFLGADGYLTTPVPLTLQISTDAGVTWSDLYQHTSANSTFATTNALTGWRENVVLLNAYVNQSVIFRFSGNSNYGYGICDQGIDEFVIENETSCTPPSNLSATNISANSADLNWTENGTATTWQIEWGPVGFIQGSGTMVTGITAKPYNLSGLTANSQYSYYVRSNCSVVSNSEWVGPDTFELVPSPTITGATEICFGGNPEIYFTQPGKTNYQWSVSAGGTIIFGGGPADDLVMILWAAPGTQSVSVNFANATGIPAPVPTVLPVTVFQPFMAGTIGSDQSICYNTVPALLTGGAPTGGNVPYSYQWEISTDGTAFVDIPGATSLDYQPGALMQTTWYRQKQVSYSSCGIASTNIVMVAVAATLVPGSIASDQIICYSEDPPAMLTGTAPTGGIGPYSYQWEISTDGTAFIDIIGATNLNYQPGVVAQTTYFKLKQTSGNSCGFVYTNVLTITVYPALNAGSIGANQTICNNAMPILLTSTAPTGGNTPYTYQWASSTNGTSFTDIPGATGTTYQPGTLMQTTYFLLQQTSASGCGTVLTNWVTITVNPAFTVGSIAASQIIDYNTVPVPLTGTEPTGGLSPYAYQWQNSLDGTSFTDITGATTLNYAPAALMATTYYRQIQTSDANCGSDMTNVVTITVNPQDVPATLTLQGVVVGSGQTNCYNATQTIYVAGSGTTFIVQTGGSATMIAGHNIFYYPGTTVQPGGYMHGYIAPAGPWCGVQPPSMVSIVTGTDENPLFATQAIFKIYPNPTTGNFTVEQTGEKIYDKVKVEVYSMIGGRVFTGEMTGERKQMFSLEDVPVGVYFIRLLAGDKPETVKIIKH